MSQHDSSKDRQSAGSGNMWQRVRARLAAIKAARAERIARWENERKQKTGWHARKPDAAKSTHRLEPMEGRVHLSAPAFETALAAQYMTTERALTIGVNGFDADGDALTIDVQTNNPGLVAFVPDGNRFARMRYVDVDDQGVRTHIGDIIVELFEVRGSTAAERFITLSTNEVESNGALNPNGTPFYTDVLVHRVIEDFIIQTGDAELGNGTGGSPLGDFDDDFDDTLSFAGKGVLAMANSGADTNDSQWFITAQETPNLDPFDGDNSSHMIFGQVVAGYDVFTEINERDVDNDDQPLTDVLLESVEIFENDEDFTITFIPQDDFDGDTVEVTVTLTDSNNESVQQTILIDVVGLAERDDLIATPGQVTNFTNFGNGGGIDRNIDLAISSTLTGATVSASDANNRISITAPATFSGYFEVTVTARPASTQLVRASQTYGVIAQAGSDPQVIDRIEAGGDAKDAVVDNGLLYLALGTGGFAVYDISTPESPQLLDTLTTGDSINEIRKSGDFVFALDDDEHLLSIDVSDPADIVLEDIADLDADGSDLLINGNRLYVTQGADGVKVYNIADPAQPVLVETFETIGAVDLGTVVGIERKNSYFFFLASNGDLFAARDLGGNRGLRVVDVLALGGTARDMALDKDHLYIADSLLGLKVIDISNPGAIAQVGARQELLTNYDTVRILNETAVVGHSTNRGYTLIDISDPTNPEQEGKFQTRDTGGIAFTDGSRTYLPLGEDGLATVNTRQISERSTVFTRLSVELPDGRFMRIHASTGGYFPVPSRVRVTTDDAGNVERLSIVGANESTVVRIAVTGGEPVDVETLLIDGDIRMLLAPGIRVTDTFTSEGYVGLLLVDQLSGDVSIDEGPTDRHRVTLVANRIEDATIESEAPINLLRVGEWTDTDTDEDSLTAPWVGRILTTGARGLSGDFQAGLTLDEAGFRGRSLGIASIRGDIAARTWLLTSGAFLIAADSIVDGFRLNASDGGIGRLLTRGNLSGTFAATDFGIISVLGDMNEANILAGTDLGDNATIGGTSANVDSFNAGYIRRLIVRGAMLNSLVSGGLTPGNSILGDADDQRIAGSRLGPVAVLGEVDNSVFIAETYPRLTLLERMRVDPLNDAENRFVLTDVVSGT